MKLGSILALLAVAALLGWNAPRLAGDNHSLQPGTAPADPGKVSWNAGQTVLERQPDGHFYASATVDDTPVRFLVDTGASVVALTGADAEAAGLSWEDSDLQRIGSGASGPVYGVPIMLDRVELGGVEARGVQAAIIPEGLGVSLLGQSVLSRMEVEIAGDEMRLGG